MTAMSDPGYTPGYTLDNSWREARERLGYLEAVCDPFTEEHLDKIGVGAGWRCLEVGAGGGSVVRILCDRVGPEGHVLAVDLEPTLLADLDRTNLEVRKFDVVVDELPEGAFDLIHTRAVLLHIASREELIPRLVRSLRPGGVLLLEEPDLTPTFQTNDIVHRAMEAMYRPIREADTGFELFWAYEMPTLLEPAGLVDVKSVTDRITFGAGDPMAKFFRVTWQQFLESQPYTDEERALMEEGRAAMLVPGPTYLAWDLVSAWGRRP